MTVPACARDRFGDHRQAGVGLAVPGEAFAEYGDALKPATPFARQQGAGTQVDAVAGGRRPIGERDEGRMIPHVLNGPQASLRRRAEITECGGLDPVAEQARQ
jgi:hypothetical protein